MALAAATGISPREISALDWLELVTLADVVAEQHSPRKG
jgi:hypothetical protein